MFIGTDILSRFASVPHIEMPLVDSFLLPEDELDPNLCWSDLWSQRAPFVCNRRVVLTNGILPQLGEGFAQIQFSFHSQKEFLTNGVHSWQGTMLPSGSNYKFYVAGKTVSRELRAPR